MTRNAGWALLAAVTVAGCTTNVYGCDAGAGGTGSDSGGAGFGLSANSGLVGEWSMPVPNEPGLTAGWYFDADGNCGNFASRARSAPICLTSTCTYTFDGTTLTTTLSRGSSAPGTSEATVAFSRGGYAATLTSPGCDAGPGLCETSLKREDFTDNHRCPSATDPTRPGTPMLWKVVMSVLTVGVVFWAYSFLRSAIVTLRTGRPFFVQGHRDGSMQIQASFGRIGAVFITATVIAIAYVIVRMVLVVWGL